MDDRRERARPEMEVSEEGFCVASELGFRVSCGAEGAPP